MILWDLTRKVQSIRYYRDILISPKNQFRLTWYLNGFTMSNPHGNISRSILGTRNTFIDRINGYIKMEIFKESRRHEIKNCHIFKSYINLKGNIYGGQRLWKGYRTAASNTCAKWNTDGKFSTIINLLLTYHCEESNWKFTEAVDSCILKPHNSSKWTEFQTFTTPEIS